MRYLYETHMHTMEVSACASSLAVDQVRRYKELGYTGVIVTDHFMNGNAIPPPSGSWKRKMEFMMVGYENAFNEGKRIGLDVFLGWEFNIVDKGTEFLTYGLDMDFLLTNPGIDRISVEDYSRLVRENGGYLAQAHPFRQSPWVGYKKAVAAHLMDGIEVYNSTMPDDVNEMAQTYAEMNGLIMQAGSDSHSTRHQKFSGISLDFRAESIFDIIDALRDGLVKLII